MALGTFQTLIAFLIALAHKESSGTDSLEQMVHPVYIAQTSEIAYEFFVIKWRRITVVI